MNKGEKTKIVEKKMLKFEDAKLRLEERAADDCRKERSLVHSLLMKKREDQINTLQSNQEFMEEWNKKGKQAWRANMSKTKERIDKAQRLEDKLTNRYKDMLHKQIGDATSEVVDGIEQFEKNLQRLGIDTSANVDEGADPKGAAKGAEKPKKEGKPLGGFSYAATMNKIKEKKTLGDFARKERDRRRRKMQVDQARTQATVEKKKREEELIAKFGRSSVQDRRDGYEEWKFRESKRIIEQLRLKKERDFESERGKETAALAQADEATKDERANVHRKEYREKRKVHRDLRRKEKAEKRLIHREICSDVFDKIMEIVDEASYTIKKEGALERKRWREWMETFKEGGQVSQFESAAFLGVTTQIEYEVPEEVEKGLENVDLDELQNYLACIGRWRTEHLF